MQFYPSPFDKQGTLDWIERNLRRYEEDGSGLRAVVLKSSGKMIGDCGPVWQEVDGKRQLEIGYHIRRDHWGRGYATEAAHAAMVYAFEKFPVGRLDLADQTREPPFTTSGGKEWSANRSRNRLEGNSALRVRDQSDEFRQR